MMRRKEPRGLRGRVPSTGPRGKWLVTFPAWGERCVSVLIRAAIPAALASLDSAGVAYELLIWTDQPDRINAVLPADVNRRMLPVPGPDRAFESLSNCHRYALEHATLHDRVLLLTADMVVSLEAVANCERLLMSGMQLVCCVAPRATDGPLVPIAAPGRELLAWAWDNRHRMTQECTWPHGRSYDIWRMYFEKGNEVAARAFLPHPLAVLPRQRRLNFRPTIDVNLSSNFSRANTHLITRPEYGAAVELSPPDKEFLETDPMHVRYHTRGPSVPAFVRQTNPRHRMFWGQRVVIKGAGGDCGDLDVVRRMMG